MRFIKSFSLTLTSSILITILGIVNNIIITRQIGVVDRGKYSVIMSFIMIVGLILGEGIKRSNTITIGQNKNYLKNLSNKTFFYSITIILFLFFLFSYTEVFSFFLLNIPNKLISISLVSIGIYIYWLSIQAIFLGLQELKPYNILQVSTISFTLIINVIGIIFFNFQIYEILLSYLVATIITSLIAYKIIKSKENGIDTQVKVSVFKLVLLGSKSTISGLSSFIMVRSGIFFSNFFLEPKQTGLYSIALLFFEIMQKIPNTFGVLVISRIANDKEKTDSKNVVKLIRIMFVINSILTISLVFFGKFIIVLLFGSEFENSYSIILYMLPAFILIGPSSVVYSFYMGTGYPKKIILLNVFCALLTLVLFFVFTKFEGIYFIALVSSIVLSIWTFVLIVYFRLDTKFNFSEIIIPKKQDLIYIFTEIKFLLQKVI